MGEFKNIQGYEFILSGTDIITKITSRICFDKMTSIRTKINIKSQDFANFDTGYKVDSRKPKYGMPWTYYGYNECYLFVTEKEALSFCNKMNKKGEKMTEEEGAWCSLAHPTSVLITVLQKKVDDEGLYKRLEGLKKKELKEIIRDLWMFIKIKEDK